MKATRLSLECPICNRLLDERTELREHLERDHAARELAAYIENELEEPME